LFFPFYVIKKFVSKKKKKEKKRKKSNQSCINRGIDFLPFAMESLGAFGLEASTFLKKLLEIVSSRSLSPPSVLLQSISVSLQKQFCKCEKKKKKKILW